MALEFFKTSIEREIFRAKIRSRERKGLKRIFRKQKIINEGLGEEIETRLNGEINNFLTIFITGQQGTFKSSLGFELAMKIDKNFTANNFCFDYFDFKKKLSESKPKQCFILDEQIFSQGVGSNRIKSELKTFIETLRKRQNSMIVISPKLKDLDESDFTFMVETIDKDVKGICKKSKRLHEIRTCENKKHEKIVCHVRSAIKSDCEYLGLLITKISWNHPIWNDYEKLKDAFMDTVVKSDHQKNDYEQMALDVLSDSEIEYYKTSKSLTLFLEKKYPNLTVGEKDLIKEQIKIVRAKNGC